MREDRAASLVETATDKTLRATLAALAAAEAVVPNAEAVSILEDRAAAATETAADNVVTAAEAVAACASALVAAAEAVAPCVSPVVPSAEAVSIRPESAASLVETARDNTLTAALAAAA
jgi:hypothetical protein